MPATGHAMDVVIVGAGIAGLVAAVSLHDAGVDRVEVMEAAAELRPLGAGINLLPNAVRELAALGVYHEVVALAAATTEVRYHNQRGDLILSEPRGRSGGYHWPQLSIRRGDLQSVLIRAVTERLGAHSLRTGARVTDVADLDADVIIGADGINSTVRDHVTGERREPVWNGMVVWRGMTWAPPLDPPGSMVVMGDGVRKIVAYAVTPPREDGRVLVNWAASLTDRDADRADWNRGVPASKFAGHFTGWRAGNLLVTDLFDGAGACFEYPLLDRDPLPAWTRGRVTLAGDAAHAMQPMGSNATTQAIIDARALAYFLATEPTPSGAFAAYERHRRPVTTRVQLANRDMGPEAVIDVVARRAPGGFTAVEDVLPVARLREIGDRYAELAVFDRGSVNARSPYDIRRVRLVGENTTRKQDQAV